MRGGHVFAKFLEFSVIFLFQFLAQITKLSLNRLCIGVKELGLKK
jgi:hypothetical protein